MPRPLAFDPAEALEQATRVFWRQGYEATSLGDLTEAMGINRPSLYNHFGDKRALYMQALLTYFERNSKATRLELETSQDVRLTLRRIFESMVSDKNARWGCLVVNAATELGEEHQDIRDFACQSAQENEQMFAQVIRLGQERGEISQDKNAEALGKLLYNGMVAIRVRARSGASDEVLQENVELTLALLD